MNIIPTTVLCIAMGIGLTQHQEVRAQINPQSSGRASVVKRNLSKSGTSEQQASGRKQWGKGPYVTKGREKRRSERSFRAEKASVRDIANQPLRHRVYQPKELKPTRNTEQKAPRNSPEKVLTTKPITAGGSIGGKSRRTVPVRKESVSAQNSSDKRAVARNPDKKTATRWDVGWENRWTRARIASSAARSSKKEEQPWKGSITGDKIHGKREPEEGKNPHNIVKKLEVIPPTNRSLEGFTSTNGGNYSQKKIPQSTIRGIGGLRKNPSSVSLFGRNPYSNPNALPSAKPSARSQQLNNYAGNLNAPALGRNPYSSPNAMPSAKPSARSQQLNNYAGNLNAPALGRNPYSSPNALLGRLPSLSAKRASAFSGTQWVALNRINADRNPLPPLYSNTKINRSVERFKGGARAYVFKGNNLHPDSQFAHGGVENQNGERTLNATLKLFFEKNFNKSALQPQRLQKRGEKPQHDPGEKGLWYR